MTRFLTPFGASALVAILCLLSPAAEAQTTALRASECGSTLSALNDYLHLNPIPDADSYRVIATDPVLGDYEFYITQFLHNPFFALSQQEWARYNRTYTIRAQYRSNSQWSALGAACDVTTPPIPSIQLAESHCDGFIESFDELVQCEILPGATRYCFKVTDDSGLNVELFSGPSTPAQPRVSIAYHGIFYERTYNITVKAKVGGEWGPYGPVCTVSTPPLEYPQISNDFCNTTLTSMDDLFQVQRIQMSDEHVMEICNDRGYFILDTVPGCPPPPWYSFNTLSGIDYDTDYQIRIKAKYDGLTRDFGPTCTIRTPAAPPTVWDRLGEAQPGYVAAPESNWKEANFTLAAWPNPVRETLFLQLQGDYFERLPAHVRCYDHAGVEVYSRAISLTPDVVPLNFTKNVAMAAGLYFVELQIGDRFYRQKFMKEGL